MKSYLSLWDRMCHGKIIYIPPAIVESGNISLNALERTGAVLNDKLFWAKIVHSISSAFVWFLFRVSTLLLACDEMMHKSVMLLGSRSLCETSSLYASCNRICHHGHMKSLSDRWHILRMFRLLLKLEGISTMLNILVCTVGKPFYLHWHLHHWLTFPCV